MNVGSSINLPPPLIPSDARTETLRQKNCDFDFRVFSPEAWTKVPLTRNTNDALRVFEHRGGWELVLVVQNNYFNILNDMSLWVTLRSQHTAGNDKQIHATQTNTQPDCNLSLCSFSKKPQASCRLHNLNTSRHFVSPGNASVVVSVTCIMFLYWIKHFVFFHVESAESWRLRATVVFNEGDKLSVEQRKKTTNQSHKYDFYLSIWLWLGPERII